MNPTAMWEERFVELCRRHPDLVAVYESAHGRLALLLRQTVRPLDVERVTWVAETRATAQAVVRDLRGAGFVGGTVVLQWLPPRDIARIVGRWVRRWDGDPGRRSQITATIERAVADQQFLGGRWAAPARHARPVGRALDDAGLEIVKAWYETMASCWLAIQPVRRRRLVLQTHVWIAERVLSDLDHGPAGAAEELGPDGPLARALERLLSGTGASTWRPWIDLVRIDLERALRRPPERRDQAWARWLFLIPYSVPVPRRGRPVVNGGAVTNRLA